MKRLLIIRHIRYYIALYRVTRHYEMWAKLGRTCANAHYDYEVLDAIWRGER